MPAEQVSVRPLAYTPAPHFRMGGYCGIWGQILLWEDLLLAASKTMQVFRGCLTHGTFAPNTSNYWHALAVYHRPQDVSRHTWNFQKAVVAAYCCGSRLPRGRRLLAQKGRGQATPPGVKPAPHRLPKGRFGALLGQHPVGVHPVISPVAWGNLFCLVLSFCIVRWVMFPRLPHAMKLKWDEKQNP